MAKIHLEPALEQFQKGLQAELDQAYPALDGCSFTTYNLILSNPKDPIDNEGTIALLAKLGTSTFDQRCGIYKSSQKFTDYGSLVSAVVTLIVQRKQLEAMADLSESIDAATSKRYKL